jgi:hypothetical protein
MTPPFRGINASTKAGMVQTGTSSYRLTSTRNKKGAANTQPRVGPNQASTVGPNQLVILRSSRSRALTSGMTL